MTDTDHTDHRGQRVDIADKRAAVADILANGGETKSERLAYAERYADLANPVTIVKTWLGDPRFAPVPEGEAEAEEADMTEVEVAQGEIVPEEEAPHRPSDYGLVNDIRSIEDQGERAAKRLTAIESGTSARALLIADAMEDADWEHLGDGIELGEWLDRIAVMRDEVVDRLVWAAHLRGLSVRLISDQLGMSKSSVQRAIESGREDLEEAKALSQAGTMDEPTPEPDTTVGKGGKTSPAKKPNAKPDPMTVKLTQGQERLLARFVWRDKADSKGRAFLGKEEFAPGEKLVEFGLIKKGFTKKGVVHYVPTDAGTAREEQDELAAKHAIFTDTRPPTDEDIELAAEDVRQKVAANPGIGFIDLVGHLPLFLADKAVKLALQNGTVQLTQVNGVNGVSRYYPVEAPEQPQEAVEAPATATDTPSVLDALQPSFGGGTDESIDFNDMGADADPYDAIIVNLEKAGKLLDAVASVLNQPDIALAKATDADNAVTAFGSRHLAFLKAVNAATERAEGI